MNDVQALMTTISNLERRIQDLENRESGAGMLWQDFTIASVVQGVTVTTTTSLGRWARIGKTVFVEAILTFSSAGTSGQRIQVTLPNTLPAAKSVQNWLPTGGFIFQDVSVGFYGGHCFFVASRGLWFMRLRDIPSDFIGLDPTFAIASTDNISFYLVYECS